MDIPVISSIRHLIQFRKANIYVSLQIKSNKKPIRVNNLSQKIFFISVIFMNINFDIFINIFQNDYFKLLYGVCSSNIIVSFILEELQMCSLHCILVRILIVYFIDIKHTPLTGDRRYHIWVVSRKGHHPYFLQTFIKFHQTTSSDNSPTNCKKVYKISHIKLVPYFESHFGTTHKNW